MRRAGWHKGLALLTAAFALNGCAVAALPVLAGSVLATRDVVKEGKERSAAEASTASVSGVAITDPEPSAGLETEATRPPPRVVSVPLTPNSPPSGLAFRQDTGGAYNSFVSYTLTQMTSLQDPEDTESPSPASAVLKDPSSLTAERADCGSEAPTALIDLDPSGGVFAPNDGMTADPQFASGLSELRQSGIEITWISGASASDAGKVRKALSNSGLDPDGADTLLLMRYPADRKQTRRSDLASSHCIVAIAGDTRADFDELYDYLLQPGGAITLEPLINNGWFLTPLALTQN